MAVEEAVVFGVDVVHGMKVSNFKSQISRKREKCRCAARCFGVSVFRCFGVSVFRLRLCRAVFRLRFALGGAVAALPRGVSVAAARLGKTVRQ
jgi:hypothetical protein